MSWLALRWPVAYTSVGISTPARLRVALLVVLSLMLGVMGECAAGASAASAPTWFPLASAQFSAPPKYDAAAAYDPATKQFVMFGGSGSASQFTADTWLWTGLGWRAPGPATAPSARNAAMIAYDAATGQLVLFGGMGGGGLLSEDGDTWTWNGATWVQLHPVTSPPPTEGAAMAYDPVTHQIIMFGGVTSGGTISNSTWAWTGSNWQHLSPATVPGARDFASMGWDAATSQLVMFGGRQSTPGVLADFADTWLWSGTNWVQQHPATSPGARDGAPLVYDPATGQMLLIGGQSQALSTDLGDVWVWSGSTWARQAAQGLPSRTLPAAGYDAAFNQLLVFGGLRGGLDPILNDTWLWTPFAIREPFLPPGTVGLPYGGRLDPMAGTFPFAWSVISGALPPGISLAQTGALVGAPQKAGSFSFTVSVSDAAGHTATHAYTITVNAVPIAGVWVSDATNSVLRAFALGASGNAMPTVMLGGPLSQLNGPDGLVLDGTGGLYVANGNTASVNYYAAGASGNAAPLRVLSGPFTGLAVPAGMALDSAGRLYVANEAASTVTVYAAGANGNQVPVQTIGGLLTTLHQPSAVTIDAAGNIWVTDLAHSSLVEFAAGATGDIPPLQTITGPSTGLNTPVGLAQDSKGQLLVSNLYGQSVTEYFNQPPYGDTPPVLSILGASAQLDNPEGLDVDAADDLYVANEFGGVNEYLPGTATPTGILTGPATGLRSPRALAVAPPTRIITRGLPAAALRRSYSSGVFAVLGSPPLRWRLVHGRLPRGLRLSAGGRITGRPRRLGVSTFILEVRGALRRFPAVRRRLSLTVRRAPTVTAVTPARGRNHGGLRVTLTGTGFATARGQTIVRFGRLTASRVHCRSHTICTARAPAHRNGPVDVTVTVAGLSSAMSSGDRFVYRP
jgi:putative Ig domain-containing protein/IPT/TIG domain-containing protein